MRPEKSGTHRVLVTVMLGVLLGFVSWVASAILSDVVGVPLARAARHTLGDDSQGLAAHMSILGLLVPQILILLPACIAVALGMPRRSPPVGLSLCGAYMLLTLSAAVPVLSRAAGVLTTGTLAKHVLFSIGPASVGIVVVLTVHKLRRRRVHAQDAAGG